jgi:serine/threonine-protein kinase RsbT
MSDGARTIDAVRGVLGDYVSPITADGIVRGALRRTALTDRDLEGATAFEAMLGELKHGVAFFLSTDEQKAACLGRLRRLAPAESDEPAAPGETVVTIRDESGVVDARTQARAVARELGFDRTDQAKIATSVSELARNIHSYAKQGRVRFSPIAMPRRGIRIVAEDDGPGIANVDDILAGNYRSATGLGLGIRGCKKLMDEFSIDTGPGRGTRIAMQKFR